MPASACCAATSPTPRRCACAASRSTPARAFEPTVLALRRRGLHRRQVRLVPGRAAAARGDGRTAGQGRLRLRPARHLQGGRLLRRRVRRRAGGSLDRTGQYFGAFDTSYRSSFSSSASASKYLVVDGYSLVNVRVGFRAADGWTLSVWSRNLFNKDYFDLLSAAPGNIGPLRRPAGRSRRTFGVTLRLSFKSDRAPHGAGRAERVAGLADPFQIPPDPAYRHPPRA